MTAEEKQITLETATKLGFAVTFFRNNESAPIPERKLSREINWEGILSETDEDY